MALPDNVLSTTPVRGTFAAPDDVRATLLEDWEMGGIGISNPSMGLQVQTWRGYVEGNNIVLSAPSEPPFVVTTDTGITEVSFTFDTNMRPTVVYVAAGVAKHYWYDAVPENYVTTTLAAGVTSPMMTHDDKRAGRTTISDALLFYFRAGNLCYRQQRDRYNTERVLAALAPGASRIRRVGMTNRLRVQIEYDVLA